MDRYGRDYERARWGRPGLRGYDDGFAVGYSGSPGYRTPPSRNDRGGFPDNQRGRAEFGEGHDRWGPRDDSRRRFARGDHRDSDREGWGQRQPRWLRQGYDDFGSGTGRHGYTRGGHHFRGRQDEYDHDFMDRVRRGWNEFRDEAREWLHRGYDRGW